MTRDWSLVTRSFRKATRSESYGKLVMLPPPPVHPFEEELEKGKKSVCFRIRYLKHVAMMDNHIYFFLSTLKKWECSFVIRAKENDKL